MSENEGITIEPVEVVYDIPVPRGRKAVTGQGAYLRETLKAMKPGGSFMWEDNKALYRAARESGVQVTIRKVGPEGFRIWRRK